MNAASTLYKNYQHRIYPRIQDKRGATRLRSVLNRLSLRNLESYTGAPQSIFEAEDWDNLFILDACRHDLYEEVTGRSVPKRVTLGSSSRDYIQHTYRDRTCNDVVYITGNPYFHTSYFPELTGQKTGDVFHDISHVYLNRWDDEHGTVLADDMVAAAQEAAEQYPAKRKVVHFMQPHLPFVPNRVGDGFTQEHTGSDNVWKRCERGEISADEAWVAYKENLRYVLPHVHRLAEQLGRTTVVTADHGNLVGEGGRFSHPGGCDAKVLREVPWHEL